MERKEGWLRKKGSRMHRWWWRTLNLTYLNATNELFLSRSNRYFILDGSKLSYRIKPETDDRSSFDLVPGTIVTEVCIPISNSWYPAPRAWCICYRPTGLVIGESFGIWYIRLREYNPGYNNQICLLITLDFI